MTEEQTAAYINSQVACAQIEAMGMAAANSQYPHDQPYGDEDFKALIEKYGIHHNAVIATCRGIE